ncbi:MAG TPA: calcium-binding protein [Actinomycetota bacterium]|nr:calcium-binding protein [Actinomycetota bacterium]
MSRRSMSLVALAALLASVAITPPASGARTCFGKSATIVGSNRSQREAVELHGTRGDDVIVGLGGWDIVDGRGGNDLICTGGGDDYVEAGRGNDKIAGGDGIDTLHGGRGHDRILGGRGPADSLVGAGGNDLLFGGPGTEDSLIGGAGDDRLDGGPGYDLAEFFDATGGIEADLTTGLALGRGRDELVSIEGLSGTRFDDILVGDELSNMLQGDFGNDTISALGSEGDGGADVLRSGGGSDVLDGGDGPDIVSYNISPYPVRADLAAGDATTELGQDTLIGIEHLVGSKYDDTLTGNGADNVIVGNRGDDVMDGGEGIDEIAFFDSAAPVVADLVEGTALAEGWGSDTFTSFENLSGSAYADTLTGSDDANLIWGGGRNDTLRGLAGDDTLLGATGVDDADGGDGTDACEAETQSACESVPARAGTPASFGWAPSGRWSPW